MRKSGLWPILVLLVFASAAIAAQDRGVSVTLKQSERPGAPDAGRVKLYSASYALVIGIDDYKAGWPRLSNAVKDATLVAEELSKQGFQTTLKTDLDSRELEDALEEFFVLKGQDPEARLFVWFAGHGHTMDGEGFIVPADAPRPGEKGRFKITALSMRRFGELTRLAESKHALAVFDSCFSGTVFDTGRAMPPPCITRYTTMPARQFVSAGDADQTVSDDGRFRRLFVNALQGTEKADLNQDGYLTGSELGMFLSDRLSNLTNNRQTPRYGKLQDDRWDKGDFVFLVAAGGAVTKEDPAPAPMGDALLSVSADVPGAEVFLNGGSIGTAPVREKSVKPGTYQLQVERAGYQTYRTRVALSPGRHAELSAYLEKEGPKPARLYVDALPSEAKVRLVDPDAEYTPGIELAAGNYRVEVSAEGFVTQRQPVEVHAGQDRYFTVRLVKASGEIKLADLTQARQDLLLAEQNFQRMSRLYEAGALSTSDYNAAKERLFLTGRKVKDLEGGLENGADGREAGPTHWKDEGLGWSLENVSVEDREAVAVSDVVPSGRSEKAGLRKGDIILDINRLRVRSVSDAKRIAGDASADGDLLLHILRGGHDFYATIEKGRGEAKSFTNSIGQEFVYIPPGTFIMGSPESEPGRKDDETQHQVTLTKGFYMQTTEVTQGQWKRVMGDNPSSFKNCGDDCPVEQVSWDDAQEFIRKLNRLEGRNYRLPTEAEWEHTCRAGTSTPFNTGPCLDAKRANYDGSKPYHGCGKGPYRKKVIPVGSFSPNAWGLHDMHGNVWEWCQDWYGSYPSESASDYKGPAGGSFRVFRGGSWRHDALLCRSALRGRRIPSFRGDGLGFRLVCPE